MKKPVFLTVGQTALPLPRFICLWFIYLVSFTFDSNDNARIGKGSAFCPTMKMGLGLE
jgi:hypothetical protein